MASTPCSFTAVTKRATSSRAAGTDGIGCAAAGLLCAGDFYEASGVVDYVINKHYDAYFGLNYSEVTDGLASGFVGTPGKAATYGSENQVTGMVGFRVKF